MLHDTACAEGWGLYSERLADEMGLYSDDLARMGLFAADSWRASRLVVDTGLHAMGWTRRQALDWMAEHTPLPRIEIESEVDRYISYPGQALAYMVGRREIVRLRTAAADALGTGFDLKDFHDLVLRAGILPLPALAAHRRALDGARRLVARPSGPPDAGPAAVRYCSNGECWLRIALSTVSTHCRGVQRPTSGRAAISSSSGIRMDVWRSGSVNWASVCVEDLVGEVRASDAPAPARPRGVTDGRRSRR